MESDSLVHKSLLTLHLPSLLRTGDLGDADENVEQLCWGTDANSSIWEASKATAESSQQNKPSLATAGMDDQEPLALLVVHAAMHMLFLPQFTCDFYEEAHPSTTGASTANVSNNSNSHKSSSKMERSKDDRDVKIELGLRDKQVEAGVPLDATPASIVWAPGVGVSLSDILGSDAHHHGSSGTRKYDKNRIEVLRLLLTASCDPLYSPADEYNPLASRWLAVATAADAPNSICLFYSLLNTILGYDPKTIPVATGFSEGNHMKLLELSVQVLCVLLDCGIPGQPEPVHDQNNAPCVEYEVASRGGFNIFRTLLARIDEGVELNFIYNGFTRLLRNVYEAESTYMGGTKLGCYQELLVLFWKFLEENPYFMSHILNRCDVNGILVPICFLMNRSRRDPAHIGLVHICTFVLLKLSGERSFGVSLNRAFKKKLPTDLPLFHGCHTDLLVITLHKLVVNGAYKLVPLYSCFLTIIANISPYWKSMSLVAAVKMVNCMWHFLSCACACLFKRFLICASFFRFIQQCSV
jgi:Dyggve-Melchior-Clausen syndrome protein